MKNKLFSNESTTTNLLFAVLIVLVIMGVILLNMVAASLSERYPLSADLTRNAVYRIGDDTKAVLDTVSTDIDMYVLSTESRFTGNSYLVQLQRILEQYPKYCSHITLRYVDFAADPTFAASYPDFELADGDVLIVSTFGIRQLPLSNMFVYTYDASGSLTVNACRGEEAVTSAIVGVLTSDPVRVGFLEGNDVSDDVSTFKTILDNNNFEVSGVNAVTGSFDEYDVLLLIAPKTDLSEDTLSRLDSFLYNDGQFGRVLLYSAAVDQPSLPNLDAFLREWGIAIEDGAVFETSEDRAYSYQPYYPYVDYAEETYSAMLKDSSNPYIAPLSRPMSAVFSFRDNKTVTTLLSFGETAGIRPSDATDSFTASQAETWGPFPSLLLSVWQTGAEGKSAVIASGSSAAFGGTVLGNTAFSNSEYIVNVLNNLTDREGTVPIDAKSLAGEALTISTAGASRLGITLCVIVPVLILALGIAVFLRRRYK